MIACQSDNCTGEAVFTVSVVGRPMHFCATCVPPLPTAEQVLDGGAKWTLLFGDCLEALRRLPDHSVDAIVTDPPSGIKFMNAHWDTDKGGRDTWIAWLEKIFIELARVAKPGAYAVVWALPRTSHWTAMAIENAGWGIRDRLEHLFGQGFPKNHNVSLAIDKQFVENVEVVLEGPSPPPDAEGWTNEGWRRVTVRRVGAERPVIGTRTFTGSAAVSTKDKGGTYGVQVGTAPAIEVAVTGPATEDAKTWEGWGTALKPAAEDWWLARAPLSESTVAKNVLAHGTGGINIDGTRIFTDWNEADRPDSWKASGHSAKPDADKIAAPPGDGIECHPMGRYPSHLLLSHSPSCVLVGTKDVPRALKAKAGAADGNGIYGDGLNQAPVVLAEGTEKQDVFDCAPDCPVRLLDEQSGHLPAGTAVRHRSGGNTFGGDQPKPTMADLGYGDTGTAARYFTTFPPPVEEAIRFRYLAKPSTAEREFGLETFEPERVNDGRETEIDNPYQRGETERKNTHITVKSIALMRWLCRLVTRPGGIVLDPFAGSGTTLIAARREGFRAIGIDDNASYVSIARARIQRWEQVRPDIDEAEAIRQANAAASAKDRRQQPLFSQGIGK